MYIQIANHLKARISGGEISPGQRLGSNVDLMREYGVGKITVRQALEVLQQEGLVTSRRGKGTFAMPVRVEQDLSRLLTLNEIMSASGFKPQVNILEYAFVKPTADVQEFFGIAPREAVLRIVRQYVVQDLPLVVARICLPKEVGEQISASELASYSLTSLLETKLGLRIGNAHQCIRACGASSELCRLLNIKLRSPVLMSELRTYSTEGTPLEHLTFFYRAEQYEFRVRLRGSGDTAAVLPDGETAYTAT